jgi:serine/threonine protein phosphatase PrpC
MQQLNAAFLQRAEAQGWDDGSTAVVALLSQQQLLVANVGNSKALLCRGRRSTQEEEEDEGDTKTPGESMTSPFQPHQ